MTIDQRLKLLVQLGDYLQSDDELLQAVMHRTAYNNKWLTIDNCKKVAQAIGKNCLNQTALQNWIKHYNYQENTTSKKVAILLSGNVPFAGLQDIIAVFAAGHQSLVKIADSDEYLIPHLIKQMMVWNPASASFFEIRDFIKGYDAILINNKGNENPYFKKYFKDYPSLIRKEQTSIAILDGQESDEELAALGKDIFANYGLGKENISKIYVPEGYDFHPLLEALHEFNDVILNSKYKNNFDYNYSFYLLNNRKYHANGCILISESKLLNSRIACLHYEFYQDAGTFAVKWDKKFLEGIKYIVSRQAINGLSTILPGATQIPSLFNYADDVDTMEFLMELETIKQT